MKNNKEPRFKLNHRDRSYIVTEKLEATTVERHWHDDYMIEFIACGEGTHRLNDKEYPIERGSMYVIRLRDYHEMTVTAPTVIHRITLPVANMPERFVRSMLKRKTNLITKMDEDMATHVENLFNLVESRPVAESEEEIYIQESLLNVIIMLFTREVNVNPGDTVTPEHAKVYDTLLFIEDNFRSKLSLQSVADSLGMNPSYLNRIVKEHTGLTVYSAVKRTRLRYAAKLCRETDMQSKDICATCGYSGDANFQRDFKKEYGVSPRKYRKAAREGLFDEEGDIVMEVYEKKMKERENARKQAEASKTEE